jgi:hypothetical protein
VSEMIGRVRYSPARGVMVREPGEVTNVHSAVSGNVAVYVDSLTESRAVIAAWDEIIEAANEKVKEILSRMEG